MRDAKTQFSVAGAPDIEQNLQTVPLLLTHLESVLSHPASRLSRGHFYFVLTGHFYVAPTVVLSVAGYQVRTLITCARTGSSLVMS